MLCDAMVLGANNFCLPSAPSSTTWLSTVLRSGGVYEPCIASFQMSRYSGSTRGPRAATAGASAPGGLVAHQHFLGH